MEKEAAINYLNEASSQVGAAMYQLDEVNNSGFIEPNMHVCMEASLKIAQYIIRREIESLIKSN